MAMRSNAKRAAGRTIKSDNVERSRGTSADGLTDAIVETKKSKQNERERSTAEPTHEEIAARAYELWLERGGNDIVNWIEAESELRQAASH